MTIHSICIGNFIGVLLLFSMFNQCNKTNNTFETWMDNLPDGLNLGQMSLPGTHNSLAKCGNVKQHDLIRMLSDPWYICQSLSFSEQLKAGIRFFDIRCAIDNGKLPIYHSDAFQGIYLHEVLDILATYLSIHTSETVVLSIQRENTSVSEVEFSRTLENYLRTARIHQFYWAETFIPRLGQVRGKFVLIQKPTSHKFGISNSMMRVQNNYECPPEVKWTHVQQHLSTAASDNQIEDTLYLNYISGYCKMPVLCWPSNYAQTMNKHLSNWLKDNANGLRYGILAMDFPGDDVIRDIIDNNSLTAMTFI